MNLGRANAQSTIFGVVDILCNASQPAVVNYAGYQVGY